MKAFRLTARGVGMLVSGIVVGCAGLLTHSVVLLGAGVFCVVVVGLSVGWALLRRAGCDIARVTLPLTARLGEDVTAAAELTVGRPDGGPALVGGLVPDWGMAAGADDQPWARVVLDQHEVDVRRPFMAVRRGIHDWPRVSLDLPDPLGIASGLVAGDTGGRTVVFPRVEPLAEGRMPVAPGSGEGEPVIEDARQGFGNDRTDAVPRIFQPGDDLRRMHWPATARYDQPMVRAQDPQPTRRAVISLDCSSRGYRTEDGFERAVSAAASIAVWLIDRGWAVSLRTTSGRRLTAQPWPQGQRGQLEVLTVLAALQPDEIGPAAAEAASEPIDASYAVIGSGSRYLSAATNLLVLQTESAPAGARPSPAADIVWDGSTTLAVVWNAAAQRWSVHS